MTEVDKVLNEVLKEGKVIITVQDRNFGVKMGGKCIFCKEAIDSQCPARLEDNKMFMLEILLEQTDFDRELFMDSPMCDDCDKTIFNFFNFKSNFMETEDEFLNYVNSDNKLDLYNVLVLTGKLKRFANEQVAIKVCRICLKATQLEDYREIKSLESNLSRMITACLPEFNINLTKQTYLCPECHSALLQYFHFLLLCSEVPTSRKRVSAEIADPLALDNGESVEKRQKLEEIVPPSEPSPILPLLIPVVPKKRGPEVPTSRKKVTTEIADPLALDNSESVEKRQKLEEIVPPSETSSISPLLIPVVPQKRGRGRPRKYEKLENKTSTSSRNKEKQKTKSDPLDIEKKNNKKKEDTNKTHEVDEIDSYECQICPEICSTIKSLNEHMGFHQRASKFTCWKCGWVCYNFLALRRHFCQHKLGLYKIIKAKEYTAADEESFHKPYVTTTEAYSSDLISLNGKKLPKKRGRKPKWYTNSTSSSTSYLKSANAPKKEESSVEFYECQICPGVFQTPSSLMDHLLFHKSQKEIVCWQCGETYTCLKSLKDHFTSHGLLDFYKVVNSKGSQVNVISEEDLFSSSTDFKKSRTKSPSPSDSTSSVPCPTCQKNFYNIDDYMTHTCTFISAQVQQKSNKKMKEEQEFGCGHCCAVFYSLDDLDEHNCIVSPTGDQNKDPLDVTDTNKISTPDNLNLLGSTPTKKNNEPDYECSYCLLTFLTIKGLDKHHCKGAPDEVPTTKEPKLQEVKKESIFECFHCSTLFETSIEMEQHKCSRQDTADCLNNVPVDPASIPFVTADDNVNKLIKNDSDYYDFLVEESEIDMGQENCDKTNNEKKSISPSLESKINVDKNNEEKLKNDAKTNRLKNSIVNMFGVDIAELGENKDQSTRNKLNCIGCDFSTFNETDLLFHSKCCEKVLKCNYCNYETNISQKLEMHSWAVHNIITYVCFYCPFMTSMEENYELHKLTHREFLTDINDLKGTIEDDCEGDILIHREPRSVQKLHNKSNDNRAESMHERHRADDLYNSEGSLGDKVVDRLQPTRNGGQTDIVEIFDREQSETNNIEERQNIENINQHSVNEDIVSADQIWSDDSNTSMEDSLAFQIIIPASEAGKDNVTEPRASLSTEPVWLVESSHLNENLAQPEQSSEISTLEENSSNENQNELIIPDRIISDPLENVKLEPHSKQLGTLNKSLQSSTDITETVVINCDSDSDSEFVESSEKKMSSVAACAEEVCTISASEASRLIAQGVPVVSESSLPTMQIESTESTCNPDSVGSTNILDTTHLPDALDTGLTQSISISSQLNLPTTPQDPENNHNKSVENSRKNSCTKATDPESSENNLGSTRQVFTENKESLSIGDEETKEEKRKDLSDKTAIATEKNSEEASDSDSSFFVTDNEDSDRDDSEELVTNSVVSNNSKNISETTKNCSSMSKSNIQKFKNNLKDSNPSREAGVRPFLPTKHSSMETDDGFVISDEDDNSMEKEDLSNSKLLGNNKQTNFSNKSNENAKEKGPVSISKKISDLLKRIDAENDNSVIISDDDDNPLVTENDSSDKPNIVTKSNENFVNELEFRNMLTSFSKQVFSQKTYINKTKKKIIGSKIQKKSNSAVSSVITNKSAVTTVKDPCVVIDDDDDFASQEKTKESSRSRNNSSSSSSVALDTDFSKEAAEESANEAGQASGDDCVFVSEESGIQQSKNLGPSKSVKSPNSSTDVKKKLKAPPNALNLFISKVKSEIKAKYPILKWGAQKSIIMDTWRNMSSLDKWPFKEEARLLRLLFKREHPELVRKRQVQKTAPAKPQIEIVETVEEILSD